MGALNLMPTGELIALAKRLGQMINHMMYYLSDAHSLKKKRSS